MRCTWHTFLLQRLHCKLELTCLCGLQVWLCGLPVAARLSLGPVYIIVSLAALILFNLGTRKQGEASAYSIFNTGMQRLPGEISEDQVDAAFRGRFM